MSGAILPDHNGGVTLAVIADYVRKLSAADKEKKEIGDKIKGIEKDAADDGIDVKILRDAVKDAKGDPQSLIDRMNKKALYLRALRSPLGDALPRIEDFNPDDLGTTDEERQKRWVDQGFQAGLRADNRDTCPHAPGTMGFDCWNEGWAEGQAQNLKGIKEPKATKPKKGAKPPAPPKPANDAGSDAAPDGESADDEIQDGSGGKTDEDWENAAP